MSAGLRHFTFAGRAASVAAAVLLAGLLGGCSKAPSKDMVTIRWVVDPNPIRVEQVAGFEKLHPNIKVIIDPDAGSQKILTQLAGGIYPDVFAIYEPATIRVFARKGVLLDLAPLMKAHGLDVGQFWPQLKPYIQQEGIVCGLPDNCGPFVVFYNKRLFREAGVPYPRKEWTWDEMMRAAKKLTKRDARGRTTQFGVGYIEPWVFIYQYGGTMFTPDGRRCVINSPEGKAAARRWASFRLTEHVTPTPSEEQGLASLGAWGGVGNLFKAERVAMQVQGRWMSIEYRKNRALEWDVAPVPQYGKVRATLLASKTYAIPKGSKRIPEAFAFLKYLVSETDEMIVAGTGDGIPSVRRFGESPEFLHNPRFPNERNNQVYLEEMEWAKALEISPFISTLDTTAIINEEMDLMWQGQQSPDAACDRIAARVNSLIRRNIANPNLMD